MMLMMMVNLSTFAQYPTTKKIKGQRVVIMTLNQAKSINNKFETLEDSLTILNGEVNGCKTSLYFTQDKLETLNHDFVKSQDSLIKVTKLYQDEVKKIDKFEYIEKKTRLQLKIGLIIVFSTWLFGILSTK